MNWQLTKIIPKTCKTCAHRNGGMEYGMCMLSGFYIQTERRVPTKCGQNFEGWTQREGLFARMRNFLFTPLPEPPQNTK